MTTLNYSSVLNQTTDAGYVAWRDELFAAFLTAGLVQTADTGQYTIGVGTRPGAGSVSGFIIMRLANSALYFKLEAGGSTTIANLWITVGTGSNGSGTLTGQLSSRRTIHSNNSATSAAVNYVTYICVVTDAVSLIWKQNSCNTSLNPSAAFCAGRTADSTGATTSTGFGVLVEGINSERDSFFQSVRTVATATTYTLGGAFTIAPGTPASTALQNGDLQVYAWWLNVPDVQPFLWGCTYKVAEVTESNTFTATLFGSTPHTYIACGKLGVNSDTIVADVSAGWAAAFIYE